MPYYILFDTETTGNQEEDRIIQFGAMVINHNGNLEIFDELCFNEIEIKLEAMEVHNITPEMIEGKPSATKTNFYQKLEELNSEKNYLIAHNIKFDLDMLKKEGFENNYQLIDTLKCAKHLFNDLPYHRLQYLRYALELYKFEKEEAKKYNITIKAHDAIGDVLVMKIFLSKLVAKCRELYPQSHPMEKLANLSMTPVLLKTITFGKYKGKKFSEIAKEDPQYLKWMKSSMSDLDEDIKHTINKVLD